MLNVLVEFIVLLGILLDMGHPDIFVPGPPLVGDALNILIFFLCGHCTAFFLPIELSWRTCSSFQSENIRLKNMAHMHHEETGKY